MHIINIKDTYEKLDINIEEAFSKILDLDKLDENKKEMLENLSRESVWKELKSMIESRKYQSTIFFIIEQERKIRQNEEKLIKELSKKYFNASDVYYKIEEDTYEVSEFKENMQLLSEDDLVFKKNHHIIKVDLRISKSAKTGYYKFITIGKIDDFKNDNISSEQYSTKVIAEKYGLNIKKHLFKFLIDKDFVVKNGNIYELTEKGIKYGGSYTDKKQIVWNERLFFPILQIFKLYILEKCNIKMFYYITHIDNLETILKYGLLPHDNPYKKIDISNKIVNKKRKDKEPIYNQSIHQYVPLYLNHLNAMLYKTQKIFGEEIVVLGISNEVVCKDKVVFTNANAAANNTSFTNDITQLLNEKFIDFSKVFRGSWIGYEKDGLDNELKQIMMAEVLIEKHIDKKYIDVIYCQNKKIKNYINGNDILSNNEFDIQIDDDGDMIISNSIIKPKKDYNIENINVIVRENMFFKEWKNDRD